MLIFIYIIRIHPYIAAIFDSSHYSKIHLIQKVWNSEKSGRNWNTWNSEKSLNQMPPKLKKFGQITPLSQLRLQALIIQLLFQKFSKLFFKV